MLEVLVSSPHEVSKPGTSSPNKQETMKMTSNKGKQKFVNELTIRAEIHKVKDVGLVLKMAQ